MFKSILCPVDFSSSSRSQLEFAKTFANAQQAKLSALHVLQIPPLDQGISSYVEIEKLLEEEARTEMAQLCGDSVTPILSDGYPVALEIIKTAESRGCDLILMPTHGYTGWKKVFIGSIYQGVLARTSVSVLALPPRFVERSGGTFTKPVHILCAIDLQKGSGALIRTTETLSNEFAASFTVAHNVDLDSYLEKMVPQDVFHDVKANIHSKILREYVDAQSAEEVVVTRGRLSENLKATCDKNRTGLVVLGLSRSSPLRLRTTLYRAVVHLDLPVLCVPVE